MNNIKSTLEMIFVIGVIGSFMVALETPSRMTEVVAFLAIVVMFKFRSAIIKMNNPRRKYNPQGNYVKTNSKRNFAK